MALVAEEIITKGTWITKVLIIVLFSVLNMVLIQTNQDSISTVF